MTVKTKFRDKLIEGIMLNNSQVVNDAISKGANPVSWAPGKGVRVLFHAAMLPEMSDDIACALVKNIRLYDLAHDKKSEIGKTGGRGVFMTACKYGNIALSKAILDRLAGHEKELDQLRNATDFAGDTALHLAAPYEAIVELLLRFGFSKDKRNRLDETPADICDERNYQESLKHLSYGGTQLWEGEGTVQRCASEGGECESCT